MGNELEIDGLYIVFSRPNFRYDQRWFFFFLFHDTYNPEERVGFFIIRIAFIFFFFRYPSNFAFVDTLFLAHFSYPG